MTTQQTLTILSQSRALEAYRNEREIYLKSLHPVVKRLGIDDKLEGKFVSIQSYSNEFGHESGVLSLTTLEKINIKSTSELVAKEKEKRAQITPKQIKEIESNLKKLQAEIRTAEENYSRYLVQQGYLSETTGSCEHTEYWSVHPLYHKEWLDDQYKRKEFPKWAVIRHSH